MNPPENGRRKPMQIYVPRHRRVAQSNCELTDGKTPTEARLSPRTSASPDEVVRRGRGQFRAPVSANVQDGQRIHESNRINATLDQLSIEPNSVLTDSSKNVSVNKLTAHIEQLTVEDSPKEDWEDLLETLDKEEEEEEEKKVAEKPVTAKAKTVHGNRDVNRNELVLDSRSPPTEYTNILDCYGFPGSFKTQHLHGVFNKYEHTRGGYKIKWMDDTRALIIFAHPQTAKRAYLENADSVQIKLRPYTGAIEFSESLDGQPVPRRPATTDMVARRLVHGALGVRGPARTAEQRQAERALLQAERDRREAKRRQDAQRAQAISDAFNE